ncbi:PadR family transcriptional regulator [Salinirubellus salinus]|jgi:DNA-binding PadR family transcriptional regulator|uniref:PadR family transcriptional regulator n=1 Tax=Salinirubellus salinus TaxID=1364945 RepID=A0A9E7R4C1_9EURY|nr:PadR family transcriptional regulator [Salinirubellus salinus]UWM54533.1 PadR family transcriptional regulator [Salinirubellus salinus]
MRTPGVTSPKPLADCSSLQRDILVSTSEMGPSSGTALLRRLREEYEYDAVDLSKSTVYDNIRRLEGMGLLDREETTGRTNTYVVSEEGRSRLLAYRRWVVDSIPPMDPSERF